ncbi:MAG TPA: hypothetical protein VM243_03770 [Phycisphaerae bacterium]|nr:hypothetical protein [Phycisphaerae bacterium]
MKRQVITLGDLAADEFPSLILDPTDPHYGWLKSDYLYPSPAGFWIIGEYRLFDARAEIPAGWYFADGGIYNGHVTDDWRDKVVRGSDTEANIGAAGGSDSHQHAAVSAGTPSGSVGAIVASEDTPEPVDPAGGLEPVQVAASGHGHPAPAFSGSPLATHQHASASSLPAYRKAGWYCYCGSV